MEGNLGVLEDCPDRDPELAAAVSAEDQTGTMRFPI
jgi:hypothetical protein